MKQFIKKIKFILFDSIGILISYTLLFIIYCENSYETSETLIKRKVFDKEIIFIATLNKFAEHPSSINLKFKGKIDGTAIVKYGFNKIMSCGSDTLSNNFEFIRKYGDWYNDTCFITFTPLTSKKGEIELDCEIYSSQKH